MAAGGSAALVRMLEILEHEICTAMALLGASKREHLHPDLLRHEQPLDNGSWTSAFPLLDG
jgi:L-lactate dehydrogenase (cytochrome)